MPAAIPVPVRQVILKRWQKGESVASLAEEAQAVSAYGAESRASFC